jgi:hypothetical protein
MGCSLCFLVLGRKLIVGYLKKSATDFLAFNSGANPSASQISYVTISYAGQSATYAGAIYVDGSSPTLSNV